MLLGSRLAVVVPAHNEAPRIAAVVGELPACVDAIVVVDDGSSDNTAEIALRTDPQRVHVVHHSRARGVGAAIGSGYRVAVALGAQVAVVMAGDAQMDPRELELVAEPVARGRADYVKGDRLKHPHAHSMPLARRVGTWGLGRLTALAIKHDELSDSQCGYTAIHRDAIEAIDIEGMWPRYGYPNDLLGQLAARGFRIAQVVVRPIYRGEPSGLRARHVPTILALIARAAWRVHVASWLAPIRS